MSEPEFCVWCGARALRDPDGRLIWIPRLDAQLAAAGPHDHELLNPGG